MILSINPSLRGGLWDLPVYFSIIGFYFFFFLFLLTYFNVRFSKTSIGHIFFRFILKIWWLFFLFEEIMQNILFLINTKKFWGGWTGRSNPVFKTMFSALVSTKRAFSIGESIFCLLFGVCVSQACGLIGLHALSFEFCWMHYKDFVEHVILTLLNILSWSQWIYVNLVLLILLEVDPYDYSLLLSCFVYRFNL